jgi:hypothetical protein
MDVEALKLLSDRLEGLSRADREVDVLIAQTFEDVSSFDMGERRATIVAAEEPGRIWVRVGCVQYAMPPVVEFTASLDAAVALVERVMKGKIGPITLLIAGSAQAQLESSDPCGWTVQVVAPTAPIALLRVLISAKIQEAGHE